MISVRLSRWSVLRAAPGVLCTSGGHTERLQSDLCVDGWQDVFMVARHALTAARLHRTAGSDARTIARCVSFCSDLAKTRIINCHMFMLLQRLSTIVSK